MRRILTLLMLVLLSLPFSAGAAADGFGQPAALQASHAPHHPPHHGLASDDIGAQADPASGIDLDCSACHANCAADLSATAWHGFDHDEIGLLEPSARFVFAMWHERPYRPKWSAPVGSGRPASSRVMH
ncbi:hypothetical protein ACLIJR_06780 [Hydrogenophaga sp. XSHU_21]